jgi:hypothetical protein
MAKSIKQKDLYIGQLITRGEHSDAQVYTIAETGIAVVLLKWKEGKHDCQQWSASSGCYVPTIKQIEYSINHNGALFPIASI